MRIDVFTIFPDMVEGFAGQSLLGKARESGRARRAGARPPRRHHRSAPHRRRRARSAAAPGWCCMPEPMFAAVERGRPAPAAALPRARRAAGSTRPAPASWPRSDGLQPPVRPLRGRRRAGARAPRRRRAVDRRLRARRRRGGGDGGARGGRPARAGRDGQRHVGRRRVLQRRPARVPALHPAGRAPRAGRCPRSCAPATTAGSPAGGGPRRSPAPRRHRPDLLEARGGLTEEEERLLAEFDL